MPIFQVILILALLIFVHELGHFLAARLQGIYANRFSIGFGPVLWKYQGKQTEYALRALPLGGFVGFPDDDPDSEIPPNDPNLLRNRPVFDRAIVISAGVIANLIFAYAVLVAQAGTVGIPTPIFKPGVLLPKVEQASVAEKAGLKAGDVVLAINGTPIPAASNSPDRLRQAIETSPNKELQLQVQRKQENLTIAITPELDQKKKVGRVGIGLFPMLEKVEIKKPSNPIESLTLAADEFNRITTQTIAGFGMLVSKFSQVADQVAGPVAIVRQGAQLAQDDPRRLFGFAALISINLAVINILPLPALDGGQLVFILFEALSGRPVPKRIEESFMQTGLVLLLGLGVFLIIRDTANWIQQ
ncbi:RIP metalloprotease RseP [Alkalinema pantanalense CENA528]|uniref:RIP metalloprotease RseP n=1 Tax=Alkalinema pantanalense TaxID=1620705 RepID=UPI003D6F3E34